MKTRKEIKKIAEWRKKQKNAQWAIDEKKIEDKKNAMKNITDDWDKLSFEQLNTPFDI